MHQHHDRSIVFSGSQQREKEEEGGRIHITRRTLSPPALHFVYFWFACRWCDQQYANILWVPDRTDLLMRTTNDHEMILLPRPAPRAIIQLRTRGGSDGDFTIRRAIDRSPRWSAEVEQHDCCSRRETMAQKRNRFSPAYSGSAQLS